MRHRRKIHRKSRRLEMHRRSVATTPKGDDLASKEKHGIGIFCKRDGNLLLFVAIRRQPIPWQPGGNQETLDSRTAPGIRDRVHLRQRQRQRQQDRREGRTTIDDRRRKNDCRGRPPGQGHCQRPAQRSEFSLARGPGTKHRFREQGWLFDLPDPRQGRMRETRYGSLPGRCQGQRDTAPIHSHDVQIAGSYHHNHQKGGNRRKGPPL
mmetsp:Transcript_13637/g.28596  ORF Transcript_13637/g.28596 Transcript_13637/m.28596 type:complete len:208 (-) Transcript_13637:978-1601(-)